MRPQTSAADRRRSLTRLVVLAPTLLAAAGCGRSDAEHAIHEVVLDSASFGDRLAPLARAIGDRRIVLLGENGHGVGELTTLKTRLVAWLHRELGFDVVVMESGFFECGHAWRRRADLGPRESLFDCLRYPFQHAEILPLFELIATRQGSEHPLELAGMDPQAQGFDSEPRPATLRAALDRADPDLARRVAAIDSALFLPDDRGGLGDEVYPWVLEHGAEARATYDSAAALVEGWPRWVLRLATGWVDRLLVRAEAEAAGAATRPARYYELRDEWMARAVTAIADSIAGPRRVVVWLHNDHARYGTFGAGGGEVRSVGEFLADWYPEDVLSVGFFLGSGVVADNSRRERTVEGIAPSGIEDFLARPGYDISYLILRDNPDPGIRAWADSTRPYLRLGLDSTALVPAAAFDALFYVDRVAPPSYQIPERSATGPP